ncbi:hypothetical protein SAMN04487958_110113 [Vreelandella subterranea]|uniref:Uncharacterized protein n=1 Tax=Vreelandella subterranea TaxID=416874 RepID=A0A1H9VRX5_9GAMM|nr:hypothetical protein [Halomonas subterranea]SES24308.1 hypothetical protein SAMN04487958_110113 [Halomonas subterranea]
MTKTGMAKRKPQLNAQGPRIDRQAIWETLRDMHAKGLAITTVDVSLLMPDAVSQGRVRDYLNGLEKGGYLARKDVPRKSGEPVQYELVKDVGVEAPRVRKDGSTPTGGLGREQMWRTLKIIGDCTARELADAATTPQVVIAEPTANEYLRFLAAAEYVAVIRAGGPGVLTRYRLVSSRWTGPRAPMIQRTKQLYDPNTGEVVYSRVTQTEGGEP